MKDLFRRLWCLIVGHDLLTKLWGMASHDQAYCARCGVVVYYPLHEQTLTDTDVPKDAYR